MRAALVKRGKKWGKGKDASLRLLTVRKLRIVFAFEKLYMGERKDMFD